MMMWLAILLVVVGYLLGWVGALRPAMHDRITKRIRVVNGVENNDLSYRYVAEWFPRGQVRPRNGRDVAVMAGWALLWPIFLAIKLAKKSGAVFVWGVNRLVPPTALERECEARSREAEIAKLIKEIE